MGLSSRDTNPDELLVSEDSSTIIALSSFPAALMAWDTTTSKQSAAITDFGSESWSYLLAPSVSDDGSRIAGPLKLLYVAAL